MKNTKTECWALSMDGEEFEPRRRRFIASAEEHGWSVRFWNAIDCRGLRMDQYPPFVSRGIRPDYPLPLKPGEVGLLSTTRMLYEYALHEVGLDYLVVFEDDAIVVGAFDFDVPENFDYLFFQDRGRHNEVNEFVGRSCGVDGYMVSRSGMEKMLSMMTSASPADMPLDLLIIAQCKSMLQWGNPLTKHCRDDRPDLICYHVDPRVKQDDEFPSSIQVPDPWHRSGHE